MMISNHELNQSKNSRPRVATRSKIMMYFWVERFTSMALPRCSFPALTNSEAVSAFSNTASIAATWLLTAALWMEHDKR